MAFVSDRQRRWYFANKGNNYVKSKGKNTSSLAITKTMKSVITRTLVAAATPVFPAALIFYKAYNIGRAGKAIWDAYEKPKNKEKSFSEFVSKSTIYGASETSKEIAKRESDRIAKNIVTNSTEIINQISRETNVGREVYSSMLEGSVKEGILSGIGNLTTYVIGGLIG